MGTRGPKPLPNNVHVLNNNPSKKSAAQLMESLQPEIEIPGCPPHLLQEAKKEWKRITPELARYGLISKLDRAALASYCQTWAMKSFADKQLDRAMKLAAQKAAEAEAKGEIYEGGDGMVIYTKAGNQIYSPHYIISKNLTYMLDRLLANFGLSPSARGRVNPSNHLQKSLFDDDPGKPNTFGFPNL